MKQLTEEQAIQLADSKAYEAMSHRERAVFQMNQDRLCMPFDIFHEAVVKTLARSVFTHEFATNKQGIIAELNGDQKSPSFEDIINLIPEEKRLISY